MEAKNLETFATDLIDVTGRVRRF